MQNGEVTGIRVPGRASQLVGTKRTNMRPVLVTRGVREERRGGRIGEEGGVRRGRGKSNIK